MVSAESSSIQMTIAPMTSRVGCSGHNRGRDIREMCVSVSSIMGKGCGKTYFLTPMSCYQTTGTRTTAWDEYRSTATNIYIECCGNCTNPDCPAALTLLIHHNTFSNLLNPMLSSNSLNLPSKVLKCRSILESAGRDILCLDFDTLASVAFPVVVHHPKSQTCC